MPLVLHYAFARFVHSKIAVCTIGTDLCPMTRATRGSGRIECPGLLPAVLNVSKPLHKLDIWSETGSFPKPEANREFVIQAIAVRSLHLLSRQSAWSWSLLRSTLPNVSPYSPHLGSGIPSIPQLQADPTNPHRRRPHRARRDHRSVRAFVQSRLPPQRRGRLLRCDVV